MKRSLWIGIIFVGMTTIALAETKQPLKFPKLREKAVLTFTPQVPPTDYA